MLTAGHYHVMTSAIPYLVREYGMNMRLRRADQIRLPLSTLIQAHGMRLTPRKSDPSLAGYDGADEAFMFRIPMTKVDDEEIINKSGKKTL